MTTDAAPGALEDVRSLLNTWGIANDPGRTRFDHLGELAGDGSRWRATFGRLPAPGPDEGDRLRRLRDDLREVLGRTHVGPELARWVDEVPLVVRLAESGERAVVVAPRTPSTTGAALAAVVEAVDEGTWQRLRACPDCRFVFFDSSRRGGRTWCRMTREDENGRSCGSLAKARAKRARDRAG